VNVIIEGTLIGAISIMSSVVPENVWGAAKALGAGKKLIVSAVVNKSELKKRLFIVSPFII
jgi:hypothetical protein